MEERIAATTRARNKDKVPADYDEFCLSYADVRQAAWTIFEDCARRSDGDGESGGGGYVEGELVSFDEERVVRIRTVDADYNGSGAETELEGEDANESELVRSDVDEEILPVVVLAGSADGVSV